MPNWGLPITVANAVATNLNRRRRFEATVAICAAIGALPNAEEPLLDFFRVYSEDNENEALNLVRGCLQNYEEDNAEDILDEILEPMHGESVEVDG